MEMPSKERLLAKIREDKEQAQQPPSPESLGSNEDEIYETLRNNPDLMNQV